MTKFEIEWHDTITDKKYIQERTFAYQPFKQLVEYIEDEMEIHQGLNVSSVNLLLTEKEPIDWEVFKK